MDFLSQIHGKVIKLRGHLNDSRRHSEAVISATMAIEALIREESCRLSGNPIPKPPSKAVTDLKGQDVPGIFRLKQVRASQFLLGLNETDMRISVPSTLENILDDYRLATEGSPMNKAQCRTRIDTILLVTLAMAKKDILAKDHRLSTTSAKSVRSLHLQFEKELSLPWEIEKAPYNITGRIDYSIWDGFHSDLKANCIMVEANQKSLTGLGVKQCLACMAMRFWARKKTNMADQPIWGIATDSWDWSFLQIGPDGEFAVVTYMWFNEPQDVMSMIYKIVLSTARVAGSPPLSNRWSSDSGLSIEAMSG